MAEILQLPVDTRTRTGTAEARRLRRRGLVPGCIYGHGGDPISISVHEDVITPLVFGGQKVMDVTFSDHSQLAILRDLQWDTFGTKILHFDLLRVDRDEKVEVEVPVELRGMSPGSLAGGILTQHLHTLTIECLAYAIPDHVEVRIGGLNIGDTVHVQDVKLPEGVAVLNPPEEVVVHVSEPYAVPELAEEEAAPEAAEPEVIRRGEEAEETDEAG